MTSSVARFTTWLTGFLAAARARASEEADHGEVVEKVIIVAAAAAIAIATMAAIALAVDVKVGSIQL